MKQSPHLFVPESHVRDMSQVTEAALAHNISICSTEVKNIYERISAIETIAESIETAILIDSITKQRPKTPAPIKKTLKQKQKRTRKVLLVKTNDTTLTNGHQNIEDLNTCCGKKCINSVCKNPNCGTGKCFKESVVACPLKQQNCSLYDDFNSVTKTVKVREKKERKGKKSKMATTTETIIKQPIPQEWVSPMVKALTIASDKPFNAVDIQTIERDPIHPSETRISEISAVIETEDYMRQHQEHQEFTESHMATQMHFGKVDTAGKFSREVRITPDITQQPQESYREHHEEHQYEMHSEEMRMEQQIQMEQQRDEVKPEPEAIKFPFATPTSVPPISQFTQALMIAPHKPFSPTPQIHLEYVPLPEETTPYFPPRPFVSVANSEPKNVDTRSPFVEALTTAPERPYAPKSPKKEKVPDFMKELPAPSKEILTMTSALTVATERPFTPVLYEMEQEVVQIATTPQPPPPPKMEPQKPIYKKIETPLPAKPASHIMPSAFKPTGTTVFKPVMRTFIAEEQNISQPLGTPDLKTSFHKPSAFGLVATHGYQQQAVSQQQDYVLQQQEIEQQLQQQKMQQQQMQQQKMQQQQMQQQQLHQQQMQHQQMLQQHMQQQQMQQQYHQQQQLHQQKMLQQQLYQQQTHQQQSHQQQVSNKEQYHRQEHCRRQEMSRQPAQSDLQKSTNISGYQKNIQAKAGAFFQNAPTYDEFEHARTAAMPEPIKKPVTTIQPGQLQPNIPHTSFQPVSEDRETYNGTTVHPPVKSVCSSFINKPAPPIPYYQQNLVAQQYLAVEGSMYDPAISRTPSPILGRSASPYGHKIERIKSSAHGPPPNPLEGRRSRSSTPILTDQKYYEAKHTVEHYIPAYQEKVEHTKLQSYEGADQNKQMQYNINDSTYSTQQYQNQYSAQNQYGSQMTRIEAKEDVKHIEAMNKSEMKSIETSADSLVQVQRTKKSTEEFERTQKVKTIEIERSSTGVTQVKSNVQNVPTIGISQVSSNLQNVSLGQQHSSKTQRKIEPTYGGQQMRFDAKIIDPHQTSGYGTSQIKQNVGQQGSAPFGQQVNVSQRKSEVQNTQQMYSTASQMNQNVEYAPEPSSGEPQINVPQIRSDAPNIGSQQMYSQSQMSENIRSIQPSFSGHQINVPQMRPAPPNIGEQQMYSSSQMDQNIGSTQPSFGQQMHVPQMRSEPQSVISQCVPSGPQVGQNIASPSNVKSGENCVKKHA